MNKAVANNLIKQELDILKTRPYESLCELLEKPVSKNLLGRDGKNYQLSTEVVWDGEPGGDLRVIISIDNKGWRSLLPISNSFIKSPRGQTKKYR